MSFQGLEIDMLNLGDADSILVTQWSAGSPTRVLIDGGEASHYERILEFLKGRGITYLNHIVCSHPHDDHAAGLIGIVKGIDFVPENESSAILGVAYEGHKFLFTADAGVNALTRAKNSYNLEQLYWMQIPHHGSRRNINEELISYFRPKLACVSAAGNTKHPRKKVVNAFKDAQARVFSTHYPDPGGALWFAVGLVPPRSDYAEAIPLYDAE